jgi:glycosyltransferase involved in cell wall biosynthesis
MAKAHKIISKIVDTYDIDLIHAHARIPIWISESIAARRTIPLVATYHWCFKGGFPWAFFSRQGDTTIAVSEVIKQYIAREFGFDPEKITVIPNGIDVSAFYPPTPETKASARYKLEVPEERNPLIVYVSRMDGNLADAAIIAAEAVSELSRKYPGIMLLIAGDGTDFAQVKAKAGEINSSHDKEVIRCLGFLLDTPSLYAAADIVIGMSRVALEAMSMEKPVVLFGPEGSFGPVSPDNSDILGKRNYVSLNPPYPPGPGVLCRFMDELIKDPAKCASLGKFGREVVVKHHSEESVARATEKLYRQVLKS